MRRFNYDENEDHQEEIDNFFNDENSDMMQEEYDIAQSHLELGHREVNERVFFRTVKYCERSFWWRFYSYEKKMRIIKETFHRFEDMMNEG